MQDGPGRKIPRKVEAVSTLPAAETIAKLREAELGWHFVSAITANDDKVVELRKDYKAQGYRALGTEWMFVHNLEDIPVFASDPPVRELFSQAEVDAVPQGASHKRKLLPETRLYSIWSEERDCGWVTSMPHGRSAWVSSLYVHEEFRGRGYG